MERLTNISKECLLLKSSFAFAVSFKKMSLIRGNSTLVLTPEITKVFRRNKCRVPVDRFSAFNVTVLFIFNHNQKANTIQK